MSRRKRDEPPSKVLHHWLKVRARLAVAARGPEFESVEDFEVVLEERTPGHWAVSVRVTEESIDLELVTEYTYWRGRWRGHGIRVFREGEDKGQAGDDLWKAIQEHLGKAKKAGHGEDGTGPGQAETGGSGFGSVQQRRSTVLRV